MAAKPVVDRLEGDLAGSAAVVRVKLQSPAGEAAARRWGLELVPLFVALDGQGREQGRLMGTVPTATALTGLWTRRER